MNLRESIGDLVGFAMPFGCLWVTCEFDLWRVVILNFVLLGVFGLYKFFTRKERSV